MRPMPEHDPAIELQYLCLRRAQLGTQSCNTRAYYVRDPFIFRIAHDIERLVQAFAPDRRDNAKLGKMGTDCVYHGVC